MQSFEPLDAYGLLYDTKKLFLIAYFSAAYRFGGLKCPDNFTLYILEIRYILHDLLT